MLSEEELQKKWESLTFTDNFIFSHVMHDENICRQVVELILGVRIGKIHYLSAQDEHKTDPDSMRIIMDVFLRDENRIITVEMQTGHKTELPRRSRYYQSVADVSTTPSSRQYPKLPDNILIFICTFDPFDRNLPRYTFQYTCQETDHQLKLEDGSLRIFLNTATEELSNLDQKLEAFYHYLQKSLLSGVLRGKSGFAEAQPRLAKIAQYIAIFRLKPSLLPAVSQGLNRDSLKSLNVSRFSG